MRTIRFSRKYWVPIDQSDLKLKLIIMTSLVDDSAVMDGHSYTNKNKVHSCIWCNSCAKQ